MIPKIIHYCWFGHGEMPKLAVDCIASWHAHMSDWKYQLWNEDNFSIEDAPSYVREAYSAKKYAFVSDYVRLWALSTIGGLYMDVDFAVFCPFDSLVEKYDAFAGYEGSKHSPVMMGVIASASGTSLIEEMLETYSNRHFINEDGSFDMTPNTAYFSKFMVGRGFVPDGNEKDFCGLHVFPVSYFCPVLTTGEDVRDQNTYCEHMGLDSWNGKGGIKSKILSFMPSRLRTFIIKTKRIIFG